MPPLDHEQLNRLLRLLKAGRADALDGIYAIVGARMFALALGIVKNRQDAEDVVSDSIIKLVRGIGGYREGTNGYALIMRIVRNTAFDLLRRRKVRAEEDLEGFFHLTDERFSPERREDALLLEAAIARLNGEEKRMIYYRYYLDMTVREVAEETGLSKSAAERKMQDAEKKLRAILAGQEGV